MAALRKLGMSAVLSRADLGDAVYPACWQGRGVIGDWEPGERGQPTAACVFAAWTLCPPEDRCSSHMSTYVGASYACHMCTYIGASYVYMYVTHMT